MSSDGHLSYSGPVWSPAPAVTALAPRLPAYGDWPDQSVSYPHAANSSGRTIGIAIASVLLGVFLTGVLAAIAIPVFLNQRIKGSDAAARATLRDVAGLEESFYAVNGRYATNSELTATTGYRTPATVGVLVAAGPRGYCLTAQSEHSPHVLAYSSMGGFLPLGQVCA